MNREQIILAIKALPEAVQVDLLNEIIMGGVEAAAKGGKLTDLLGGALGCYGVAVFTLDEDGGHLIDGWNDDGPRGAHVDVVMNKVHDAIVAVVDSELTNTKRVEAS